MLTLHDRQVIKTFATAPIDFNAELRIARDYANNMGPAPNIDRAELAMRQLAARWRCTYNEVFVALIMNTWRDYESSCRV